MNEKEIERIILKTIAAAAEYRSGEHERIAKLVDKMHDTLYGNGKEGLTTTVDRLERAVEAAQNVWMKVVTTLVVAGVVGLLILIVQANLLNP